MKGPEQDYRFHAPQETERILKRWIVKRWFTSGKKEEWFYKNEGGLLNPALLFGKFVPWPKEGENKEKFLRLVKEEIGKAWDYLRADLLNRQENLFSSFEKLDYKVRSFCGSISWRMVIGLGGTHPWETSMTLHHLYGIPYIPGSAVKGVSRHWALLTLFENLGEKEFNNIQALGKILEEWDFEKEERLEECKASAQREKGESWEFIERNWEKIKERREELAQFQRIFGTQRNSGEVLFFDAYPKDRVELEMDIMTPHYPQYYEGKEAPTDWQDPVPIPFLTLGGNTKFKFLLAGREEQLLDTALKFLKGALANFGIGAKTALGYGIFEIDQF